jgi:hypothetical protein
MKGGELRIDSGRCAGLEGVQSDDLDGEGSTCELASRRRQAMPMITLSIGFIITSSIGGMLREGMTGSSTAL